jgi:PhzF family phenazine biosynthesis protein
MMTGNKTIYQVDAFTDIPFKGNPAGVMIVDSEITSAWMQNMALEMNLSETAFLVPQEGGFDIRYFTPSIEVPLCGHATLASAHILFTEGIVKSNNPIILNARVGKLVIRKDGDCIVMNFPVYSLTQIEVPSGFKEKVGFEPIEAWSSNDDWVIAIAGSEREIYSAKPDFSALTEKGLGHLMITAASTESDTDFVVRCFAPRSGINEDPVTGSAHCALTPLWYKKTGKKEMNSNQVSYRTGRLKVKLVDDRVEIMGQAVTVFKAELQI